MKERPILFNGAMVRAILDGRKTQTRRIVNLPSEAQDVRYYAPPSGRSQPGWADPGVNYWTPDGNGETLSNHIDSCPFGHPGDRLWVRETWQAWHKTSHEYDEWEAISVKQASASKQPEFDFGPTCDAIEYRATSKSVGPWTPSIHMPRWASRILLEIVSVRVERLNDISEEDAKAEGAPFELGVLERLILGAKAKYRSGFVRLWESINGPGSWDANPWVWVVEFKEVKP